MRNKSLLMFIALLAVLLGGVALYAVSSEEEEDTKVVATSIYPIYDVTKQLADGGDITVVNILPVGVSPHDFEPSASDQAELEGVDTLFYIMEDFDSWAIDATESINSNVNPVDLSKSAILRAYDEEDGHDDEHGVDEHNKDDHEDKHEEDEHSEDEDNHSHDHGEYDPHYWLSLESMREVSRTITDELISLDQGNSDLYEANLVSLLNEFDTLEIDLTQQRSELGEVDIVTFHDAFYYLASEFDFDIVATIEEFPGQTPGPAYIAEVGEIIDETKQTVLYSEPQLSDELVRSLVDDFGVEIAILDPIGGIGGRISYTELIRYNVETILNTNE